MVKGVNGRNALVARLAAELDRMKVPFPLVGPLVVKWCRDINGHQREIVGGLCLFVCGEF